MTTRPELPETLRDRYEVLEVLGRGGMGVVLLARDRELDRRVVVKLTLAPSDERARARALREGRTLAGLHHPNVVQVLTAGDSEVGPYLVMEYLEGGSLAELPPGLDLLTVFTRVADGLDAIHAADLLHRDLKPANILLAADGRPVIADFGLVFDPSRTALTATGQFVGTLGYMPPEILAGRLPSPASDWYGWGASLFACLTGKHPYASADLMAHASTGLPLRPDLHGIAPGVLHDALAITLDPDPERRQRPSQLLAAGGGSVARAPSSGSWDTTVARAPISARSVSVPSPVERPSPVLRTVALGLLVGVVVALAAWWPAAEVPPPEAPPVPTTPAGPSALEQARAELDARRAELLETLPGVDLVHLEGIGDEALVATYPAFSSLRFEPLLERYLRAAHDWLAACPPRARTPLDWPAYSRVIGPGASLVRITHSFQWLLENQVAGRGLAATLGLGDEPVGGRILEIWDRESVRQRVAGVRRITAAAVCRLEELDLESDPEATLMATYLAEPLHLLRRPPSPEDGGCPFEPRARVTRYLGSFLAALRDRSRNDGGFWREGVVRILGSLDDVGILSFEGRKEALDGLEAWIDRRASRIPRERVHDAGNLLVQRTRVCYTHPGDHTDLARVDAERALERFLSVCREDPEHALHFLASIRSRQVSYPHLMAHELDALQRRLAELRGELEGLVPRARPSAP